MEQWVVRSFRQPSHLRCASGEQSFGKSLAGFPRALIRIRIESDARRIVASRCGQQAFTGKLLPVPCAEDAHQTKSVLSEITGRNVPCRPWRCREGAVLFRLPGWRTHSVTSEVDDENRRSILRARWLCCALCRKKSKRLEKTQKEYRGEANNGSQGAPLSGIRQSVPREAVCASRIAFRYSWCDSQRTPPEYIGL